MYLVSETFRRQFLVIVISLDRYFVDFRTKNILHIAAQVGQCLFGVLVFSSV